MFGQMQTKGVFKGGQERDQKLKLKEGNSYLAETHKQERDSTLRSRIRVQESSDRECYTQRPGLSQKKKNLGS